MSDFSNTQSLLKFITCGSVDDGKSTLIGHILYDAKLLYADQEKALELESRVGSRGGAIDYSLLLDGLMAEREQGITIDVAYRYFTTDNRSFIVADTPGHEEYTRNMAVGASFAELAVILVDATQGVLVQTRRHARICSLMGIRFFVFAVNKMDLTGYDEANFRKIEKQIEILSRELSLENIKIIPLSATEGDNVTTKSENIKWYQGEALLTYLEQVDVSEEQQEAGFYMPVQRVCRPNHEFRGFQGQIEAGSLRVGDEITSLPSREKAHVKSIYVGDHLSEEALAGQPVTVQLDREVDVSRGCVLSADTGAQTASAVTASILWMDDDILENGKNFFVKLGTKLIPGQVNKILYTIDVNTGERHSASRLGKNEIASCRISFTDSIVVDEFRRHKTLGELILIDRVTNMTSACGVITEVHARTEDPVARRSARERRAALKGQTSIAAVFDTTLPGITRELAGKVEKQLLLDGRHTYLYAPEKGEPYELVIRHLLRAGIVVILLPRPEAVPEITKAIADAGKTCGEAEIADKIVCLRNIQEEAGPDVERIAAYIRRRSAQSALFSQDGEHI